MHYQEKFKFLNLQVIKRKNVDSNLPEEKKSFLKLNLLDKENNPCSFIVFDESVMKKVLSNPYSSLADVSVIFDLIYSNNNWNVRLIDING